MSETLHDADAEQLLHEILDSVKQHAGSTQQSDDITLVVIKRNEP